MQYVLAILVMPLALSTVCSAVESFPGQQTELWGGVRYDFEHEGRPAVVVAPHEPAEGRPWLWRGEFFGAFPSVDQALVKEGWHVAYLDCSNTFGSPDTMKKWETFYDLLTTKYELSKKPVLYGMSRGGLYVYNWAALHPDRVGLIYGDAPVCDVKSWPGGKGKGDGSPGEWKRFLDVYGMTEEQALAWKGNPIDILEPIAKAKIPILHVCGTADTGVPMVENSDVLQERYEKLGGKFELIAKEGVGHHPHSLDPPTPIVEFILKERIEE